VTVGSYKPIKQGGGAGIPMFVPMAGAATMMVFIPTGGFSRSRWTKSAHFTMLLDEHTLAHAEGEVKPSINEKVEKYTEGIKIPPEGENLFTINGKYMYAYYDRKERKLVLARF
jgi:hypothetical protein